MVENQQPLLCHLVQTTASANSLIPPRSHPQQQVKHKAQQQTRQSEPGEVHCILRDTGDCYPRSRTKLIMGFVQQMNN